MNKFIYTFIISYLLSLGAIFAQSVTKYGFESHRGTYEEVSGGKIVGTNVTGSDLNNKIVYMEVGGIAYQALSVSTQVPGLAIGFDFPYNGQSYNRFVIGTNGYIMVGNSGMNVNSEAAVTSMFPSMEEGRFNVIGIPPSTRGITRTENTEISYQVLNSSPERILVVQYKNLGAVISATNAVAEVNFQIRLHETSGDIEFIFGSGWQSSVNYIAAYAGIKGSQDGEYNLRTSDEYDWENTVKTYASKTLSWGYGNGPVEGLTYKFNYPFPCETPESQPGNLQLEYFSGRISGNFTPAETADHYLVLMSKDQQLIIPPMDGVVYSPGSQLINATVEYYGEDTNFETYTSIETGETYYLFVFAANDLCKGGPKYNTVNPLTGSKAALEKPASIEVKQVGHNEVNIGVEPDSGNNQVIIAITDEPLREGNFVREEGVFGIPSGDLNIGDNIQGGGKIVYKGEASGDIQIEELNDNTIYHIKAWSVTDALSYSDDGVNTSVLTWGKVPYEYDFSKTPSYTYPFGWERDGEAFNVSSQVSKDTVEVGSKEMLLAYVLANPNGNVNSLTTQWILLNENENRIAFDYNMIVYVGGGVSQPYNSWEENEKLEISVSTDGFTFTPVYTIDATNAPEMPSSDAWVNRNIIFDEFKGEKVKVRIQWITNQDSQLKIDNFAIYKSCPLVISEIEVKDITSNSATIIWEGEAGEWLTFVRKSGDTDFDYKKQTEPILQLTGLLPETTYEVGITTVCPEGDTARVEIIIFTTLESIPCNAPYNMVIDRVTNISARLSWEGEAEKYEIQYRKEDEDWEYIQVEGEFTYTFQNLAPDTEYTVRLRSICAENVSSNWTGAEEFTTLEEYDCLAPANLQVSEVTVSSAKLSWDADANSIGWNLRYREASITSWNDITELTENEYLLENLKENTAYSWTVQSVCEQNLESDWADSASFNTDDEKGIGMNVAESLKIFVSGNIINILNPEKIQIDMIQLFSLNGQLISEEKINSKEDLLIPVSKDQQAIIIRISGKDFTQKSTILF